MPINLQGPVFFSDLAGAKPILGLNPINLDGQELDRDLLSLIGMDIHKMLFGGTTRQLAYKSLDASALRSRVIAENLANVETPGYQRKEVSFEDQLQNLISKKLAAERTNPQHMPAGKGIDISQLEPFAYKVKDPTLPGEINNVDVDMEGSKMAENTILYSFLTKWVGFEKLNSAIAGRAS